jgi:hypothetical protein
VSLIVMTQPASIAKAASSVNSRRVNDVDRRFWRMSTRSDIDAPPLQGWTPEGRKGGAGTMLAEFRGINALSARIFRQP